MSSEGSDPILVGSCIDLVAGLEPLHLGPDAHDDPGEIITQHDGEVVGQDALELPRPDLGIELVHTGGVDRH